EGFHTFQAEICDYGRGVFPEIWWYGINNWTICTYYSYICTHLCRCSTAELQEVRAVQCAGSPVVGVIIDPIRLLFRYRIPVDHRLCRVYHRRLDRHRIPTYRNCSVEKVA